MLSLGEVILDAGHQRLGKTKTHFKRSEGSIVEKIRFGPDPCFSSMLQTDQQFPTKGSHSEGIQKNADGSYDLYFSPTAPARIEIQNQHLGLSVLHLACIVWLTGCRVVWDKDGSNPLNRRLFGSHSRVVYFAE